MCIEEVPDQDGVVMGTAHYLEVIKLESEDPASMLLLQ